MAEPNTAADTDAPVGQGRGEPTRQRILATAMGLFEEHGYERTTMRAIAAGAGVSLGSAYYYFASKEHLVQGFYDRMQVAHREAVAAHLGTDRDAAARLRHIWASWVDVAEPYHRFAGSFFRVAADPASPLSPFSPESGPAREAAIAIYRDVLDGSDLSVPRDLAARLPEMLWLAQMSLVLFWVHDSSPGQQRTRALAERAAPLVVRLLRLARLTPLRGLTRDVLALVDLAARRDPVQAAGPPQADAP